MITCPICNSGNLTEVTGKFGKYFVCSNHPLCRAKCRSISGEPDIGSLVSRCPDTILTFNNSEIKLALLKIAQLAYPEHVIPAFIVILKPRESRRVHGLWFYPQQNQISKIFIFNLSRKYEYTLATCIHELAHHCQHMIEGKTNHKRGFYEILQHLRITAHNHGFINIVETYNQIDSNDRKKLEKYFGQPQMLANNKADFYIFRVDLPNSKSPLETQGYIYSYKELNWVKSVPTSNVFEEIDLLEHNYPEYTYEIINNREHSVGSIYFCIVSASQPIHPDVLREHGFIQDEINGWIKQIKAKDYKRTIALCMKINAKPVFKGYVPKTNTKERAYKSIIEVKTKDQQVCPQCNSPLVLTTGKFGRFYSCSKFILGCKYTKPVEE
ncbi:MAG: hypothetical protein EKK54_06220 [Neisseriaceae bacterium]|nr:MAG: hypothetical protein EKK54_06220 [Neisseriaceae bacterium]